ncbi:response regulator transcription factor [Blastococcus deserti]|uniref:Response regulator n=1 Tax=Blastococcus deserti TaxID=2259033 RepID=A0ABW4XBJ0_9ACTN
MRLVLCDDHRLFAEPVAVALEGRGHQVVVATSPAEAFRAVAEEEPDMCLMDLRFPDGDGIDAIAELTRGHPLCAVVVLSGTADPGAVDEARAAGAAGFVRKDQPLSAVFAALDRIAAGRPPAPPPPPADVDGQRRGPTRQLLDALTQRERQVLRCLVHAEDTVGIARSLGVAPSTVRTHLQRVLQKLGVNNRLQAVALVANAGLDVER